MPLLFLALYPPFRRGRLAAPLMIAGVTLALLYGSYVLYARYYNGGWQ